MRALVADVRAMTWEELGECVWWSQVLIATGWLAIAVAAECVRGGLCG